MFARAVTGGRLPAYVAGAAKIGVCHDDLGPGLGDAGGMATIRKLTVALVISAAAVALGPSATAATASPGQWMPNHVSASPDQWMPNHAPV